MGRLQSGSIHQDGAITIRVYSSIWGDYNQGLFLKMGRLQCSIPQDGAITLMFYSSRRGYYNEGLFIKMGLLQSGYIHQDRVITMRVLFIKMG